MALSFDEVKAVAIQALQRSAERSGKSAIEYGQVLIDYGKGSVAASDVAKSGVNLTVRGVEGALEDITSIGSVLLDWTFSATGVCPAEDIAVAPAPAGEPAP